ncbi:MAG: GtrA family protein [Verrucomicrobia bacterium]|nr:GtrA family protein [Verrucomicrobiota bacterium]
MLIKRSKQALSFIRENDNKTVVKHVLSHDAHPLIQFAKYGVCGVIAVCIHYSIVYILGYTLLPAIGTEIPLEQKQHNSLINNIAGFFVSGIVVYWLNIRFVFKTGKHSPLVEIALFFAVSTLPLAAGVGVNWLIFQNAEMLRQFHMEKYVEHFANFGFVIASVMVNFLARKFIIFKG